MWAMLLGGGFSVSINITHFTPLIVFKPVASITVTHFTPLVIFRSV